MSATAKAWSARFVVQVDKTTQKEFVIEVHEDWAPLGAKRFKDLMLDHFFDDCRIYRVIPGFVIQWGIPASPQLYTRWGENKIKDDKRTGQTPSNLRGKFKFAWVFP